MAPLNLVDLTQDYHEHTQRVQRALNAVQGINGGCYLKYITYYKDENSRIYLTDTIKTTVISENYIDLIITSPPYNLDIDYKSCIDNQPYDEYLSFTKKWLSRCYKWLKTDGRMCLNIPLYKNKSGHQSVGADITTIAKSIGFKYHSTIIWNEGNISKSSA